MEMRKKNESNIPWTCAKVRGRQDRRSMKSTWKEETWYTKREMVEDQQGRNEKLKSCKQESKWQKLAIGEPCCHLYRNAQQGLTDLQD